MIIRAISLLILLKLSFTLFSQSQIGFGINGGIGCLFTKKENIQSPENTFYNLPSAVPQYEADLIFKNGQNLYQISVDHSSFSFTGRDRSKNILFFPELKDGRGTGIINGGRANTISISYGRILTKNRWDFSFSITSFYSKFKSEFKNIWGLSVGELDSNGLSVWQWTFTGWGDPVYSNNLQTFGIGFKPQIWFQLKHGFYACLSAELNFGFSTLVEKTYKTEFYSTTEPEKNITYYNTLSTRGTNSKILIGLVYKFDISKK